MCGCFSLALYWEPGLKPRHLLWLRIELVTLWFAGQHSIHWATPDREKYIILKVFQFILQKKHSGRRVPFGWRMWCLFVSVLDDAVTLNPIPRDGLNVVELSTWNKFLLLLQDKRRGQYFLCLGCKGECGLGSVFHWRLCGHNLLFPFPSICSSFS